MNDPQPEQVFGGTEAEEVVAVRTPVERFRDQWAAQSAPVSFLRQYGFIQRNPDLLPYAEQARIKGWAQPLIFALQGLVLTAFLLSAANWLITRDRGPQADEIAALHLQVATEANRLKGLIEADQVGLDRINHSRRTGGLTVGTSGPTLSWEEAVQKTKALIEDTQKEEAQYKYKKALEEKTLHASGDAWALFHSASPVMLVLALIFSAQFIRRGIQGDYGKIRLAKQSDDFYLYHVVASGLWMVLGLVAVLHLLLSAPAYNLASFFEGGGLLIKGLLWLGAFGLLMYTFVLISIRLYKTMVLPAPALEDILENRIFLHINIGFWMVFAVLEAGLGALSYGVYLLQKSV
ncbi:MAG TPA: hypothetical protein VNW97_18350 [Candidatus Saccharimonadales bacterium]|jgi:hypothetical protein|nr:hypothetical protein [Candidatus Saccharimonadales bacterium]